MNYYSKVIIVISVTVVLVLAICPNNCSGHGECNSGVCKCFDRLSYDGKSYTGNDCSMYRCHEGNPFSGVSSGSPSSGTFSRANYRALDEYVERKRREMRDRKSVV